MRDSPDQIIHLPNAGSQLNLRAINTSRSACLSVIFSANFFDSYNLRLENPSNESALGLQAAVLMKVTSPSPQPASLSVLRLRVVGLDQYLVGLPEKRLGL